jgi:hypothetical protein
MAAGLCTRGAAKKVGLSKLGLNGPALVVVHVRGLVKGLL